MKLIVKKEKNGQCQLALEGQDDLKITGFTIKAGVDEMMTATIDVLILPEDELLIDADDPHLTINKHLIGETKNA